MGEYRTSNQTYKKECVNREWKRTKRHYLLLVWALAFTFSSLLSVVESSPVATTIVVFDEKSNFNSPTSSPISKDLPGSFEIDNRLDPINVQQQPRETSTDYSEEKETTDDDDDDDYDQQNCTRPSAENFPPDLFTMYERQNGAIAIHFAICFYLFYMLLIICDEFFVPSIECICQELRMPSDIAGATFMAISTSGPELFTNIIGTFVTKGDIGVGTIVGSAVFNVLAVGACCGIGASMAVNKFRGEDGRVGIPLEWFSLTRDCLFYACSVGLLIIVMANRRIYWYEALSLILLYLGYIFVMCNNARIKEWAEDCVYGIHGIATGNIKRKPKRVLVSVAKNKNVKSGNIIQPALNEKTPLIIVETKKFKKMNEKCDPDYIETSNEFQFDLSATILDEILLSKALAVTDSDEVDTEEFTLCHPPFGEKWTVWTGWITSWPIRLICKFTIPDCRDFKYRKWYPITLIMCICWIAALTYIISWMMTIIGDTLQIPDSVTGLTFLAAGTSIPEVISSIIVARQGLGSMGLSNSIGSNTFDILICLGLPWLIETCFLINSDINYIEIQSGGLEYSLGLLIGSLLVFYLIIAINGYILDSRVGVVCLLTYAVFVTLACLLEMNVFFPVNLPLCY